MEMSTIMAENPLISIITINLNDLQGLRKTMTSVFDQNFSEYEYIVVDGGSSDGSKEYIEANSDGLAYWVSEPDGGIYNAMNKGIRAAKGEYFLFLNSGDWLYSDEVLKIAVDLLDGCDVLYGNMIKVFSDGREHLDKGVNGRELSLRIFIEETINHSSSFINKKIFRKYGSYDERLKIVSDWKLFLIALGLNNSQVKYLDYPFSYFNMNGISNANLSLRNRERALVLKEIVPVPIYSDYLKLKHQDSILNQPRHRKFLETDQKTISRKLHSIIFQLFS